jgi:predicted metal-dependent HD superfamily phosphohydrolase
MFNTTSLNLDLNKIIFRAYSESYRKYHNVRHVKDIIDIIEIGTKDRFSDRRHALKLAAYFHDVVYIPGATDNEELSAKFFKDNFKVKVWDPNFKSIKTVNKIILATKNHFSNEHDDAEEIVKLFLDCDIWDFGSPYENIIIENFFKLREEYMLYHYPSGKYPNSAIIKYKEGTIKFMENVYRRDNIFRIHTDRNDQAHRNIEYLLKYLEDMPL